MRKYLYILFFGLIVSCDSDVSDPELDVMQVRSLGELSTVEYTIGKLIQLDETDGEWYKWGDRKLLIKTRAVVKAGVDLKKLKEDDIKVKGKTIEIQLPSPEYTSFSMDPNFTYTEVESVSGFRDNFTQTEKNTFLKQGETAIKEDLASTDILKDAASNAEDVIRDFYKDLGFDKVIITFSSEE